MSVNNTANSQALLGNSFSIFLGDEEMTILTYQQGSWAPEWSPPQTPGSSWPSLLPLQTE